MSKEAVIKAVENLGRAYPAFKFEEGDKLIELWVDQSSIYPDLIINDAVNYIIATNKFFPSLNEFLSACRKAEKPMKIDGKYSRLLARRKELEDKLYSGEFCGSDWIELSNDFEAIDKPHTAERCRSRVTQIETKEK